MRWLLDDGPISRRRFGFRRGVAPAPPLDLASVAQIYADFAADYPGTDQPVTSLTLGGTLGLTLDESVAGGDPPGELRADGLHLTNTESYRLLAFAGGSVDGTLILLDWTPQAPPSSTWTIISMGTGSTPQQTLTISNSSFTHVGTANLPFNSLSGPGVRRVYGGFVDRAAGRSALVQPDGYIGPGVQEVTAASAFDFTRFAFAAGQAGIIHRVLIMIRPAGGEWPMDPQIVVDRFRNATRPQMAAAVEALQVDGQSLALGFNTDNATRERLKFLNRDAVKMLQGLEAAGGGGVAIHGPSQTGYGPAAATALIPATSATNVPLVYMAAHALVLHRHRLALPNPRLVVGFNGMAGQPVDHFDDDSPAITGTLGTVLFENTGKWLTEVKRVAPTATYPEMGWCQGEANLDDAAGVYLAEAAETFSDKARQATEIFGTAPRVGLYQTSGYTNSMGRQPGVARLEQVQIAKQPGRFLIGPLYPYITFDDVHPDTLTGATIAELHAIAITTLDAGGDWPVIEPTLTLGSGTFTLTFPRPMADDGAHYAAYGGIQHYGLEAVGGGSITAATLSGDGLTITGTTTGAVTGVQGAMQAADMSAHTDGNGYSYAATRMSLRERDWGQESLLLAALGQPGVTLRRWLPAFRVAP